MPEIAIKRVRSDHEKKYGREYNREKYRAMSPEQKSAYADRQRHFRNRRNESMPLDVARAKRIARNIRAVELRALRLEELRAYARQWQKEHPEQRRVHCQNRRARLKNAPGSYTVEEWNALVERFDHRCVECGLKEPEIKLTVDHIAPISRGGSNYIENIQPMCYSCNSRKGNRRIGLWRK